MTFFSCCAFPLLFICNHHLNSLFVSAKVGRRVTTWTAIAFSRSRHPMVSCLVLRNSKRADCGNSKQDFRKPLFLASTRCMRLFKTLQILHLTQRPRLTTYPLASLPQVPQVLSSFVPGTASSSIWPRLMPSMGGTSPSDVGCRVISGASSTSDLSYLWRSDKCAEGMLSVMVRFNLHSGSTNTDKMSWFNQQRVNQRLIDVH